MNGGFFMSNSFSGWNERYQQAENYIYGNGNYEIISDRRYNLTMGATVLYGLLVNALLCATVGAQVYYSINPIVFLICYFVCCLGGTFLARSSDNPVMSFLGYNLVVVPVGLVVSSCVWYYGGIDSSVVLGAFYYTMLITAIMILSSTLFPNLFANLGGILFAALIGVLISGVLMIFIPALGGVYSLFAAAVFSLYIGYDYYRAQRCLKTTDNAIDCAMDIYLDIINLFLQILRILGNGKNSSRK